MLSDNIKSLRAKKGLTQKELADMLHVTAQAVSRWENGDVEPSVNTIKDMAKIFEVSTDDLLGDNELREETAAAVEPEISEIDEESIAEKVAAKIAAEQKPVLAVCEQCNRPLYDSKEIVRYSKSHGRGNTVQHVICTKCQKENKEKARIAAINYSANCRKRSYIWGGIISAAALALWFVIALSSQFETGLLIAGIITSVLLFPFLSCLFLKNNFVGDMVEDIATFGFVRFPGLIFELSLDGIIWLLTVKLLFWILGIIIATIMTILGVAIGMIVGLFVYPFALSKSINHPESTDMI